jgi:hypothetical protein
VDSQKGTPMPQIDNDLEIGSNNNKITQHNITKLQQVIFNIIKSFKSPLLQSLKFLNMNSNRGKTIII